ncbi:MAG TPA: hypothetical protein VMB02_10365 [Candidatus Aquilonibacter sp.]|nr:hypothetical protein [Candidatus Aquilonibacter sp.]
MRRRISIALPFWGLTCMLLAVPAAAAQTSHASTSHQTTSQSYYFCVSESRSNAPTYISPIVLQDIGARGEYIVSIEADLKKSFGGFLAMHYGYAGTISCTTQNSESWIESYRKQRIEALRSHGFQVVEADWTYAGPRTVAQGGADVSATPAPAGAGQADSCDDTVVNHDLTIRRPGCGAPKVSYVVCSASDSSATAYVSATFAVTALDAATWANAFSQFLAGEYSYEGGGVGCADISLASAQTYLKNRVIGLRANGKRVVETGWTYASAPAVPVAAAPAAAALNPPPAPAPAAAAVAPAPKGTLYAVCWEQAAGMNNPKVYFGVPFAVTRRDGQVWSAAFKMFLGEKYGRESAGSAFCNVSNSLAEAEQNAQTWKGRYSNRTIVETGWSYGASSSAAAAAPITAGPESQRYVVCWAESPARRTAYFGVPFEMPAQADREAWVKEYRDFLAKKYGPVGLVNCRTLESASEAREQQQKWMDAARARDTLVQTGWKFQ